jgi:hypothetical protein
MEVMTQDHGTFKTGRIKTARRRRQTGPAARIGRNPRGRLQFS